MENKVWSPLVNFEDKYIISNYGEIRTIGRYVKNRQSTFRLKQVSLKQHKDIKGYLRVGLMVSVNKPRVFTVHRLVAKTFIPNPKNLPQINHIDCDKTNNHISNLEWCDNSRNQYHAYKSGLRGKLSDVQHDEIRFLYKQGGYTQKQLSEKFNVKQSTISNTINNIYGS